MEHRWGRRIQVNEPVRIGIYPDSAGIAKMLDLSVSGAFIATALDPPLLSRLEVIFDVRRGRHASHGQLDAHVVRVTPAGVGIEWADVSPVFVTQLMSMFEFIALTPDQLSEPQGHRASLASKTRTRHHRSRSTS